MAERRIQPLLPRRAFIGRVATHVLIGAGIIAVSLLFGVLGYHYIAQLRWIDALLNAAMIMTGMGPVDILRTTAAKLFASFYAIFSGVIFLTTFSIVMAPIFHRFLHHFHLDLSEGEHDDA